MKQIKSVIVLVCICAVISLALAITNFITAPIIEQNQNAAANEALLEVMPDGKDFKEIDISTFTLPATVTQAYGESGGGYVIRLTTTGYGSGMNLMVGIKADATVSGAVCLSSNETLGYEKNYGSNFVGKDMAGVDAVDTISGATLTTTAYRSAVKDAINAATILGGGSADLRTEEEILQDNLNEALPAGEGRFEKVFIAEVIDGMDAVDAIYKAENGKGYVVVMGEAFIAVDENGKANTIDGTVAENIIAAISATEITDIDLSAYEVHKRVISAKKTSTGNYIIEIEAAGYGIVGGDDYHPASGKYIVIRVSVTADGKIIDCLTVSQEESKNIGDACAKEEFYGQFDGRTEADYNEIDAISGATMTTDGYKTAIGRVFDTVKILEGGVRNEE